MHQLVAGGVVRGPIFVATEVSDDYIAWLALEKPQGLRSGSTRENLDASPFELVSRLSIIVRLIIDPQHSIATQRVSHGPSSTSPRLL
jgi:hypothetical protein